MPRARRRQAHRTRLASLGPQERWCIQHGDREAHWAFATEADWDETYDSVKGALLEELDDPAAQFRGFWLYEPGLPDELRREVNRYGHVLAPEPMQAEIKAEYQRLIDARRAWLKGHGR